MIKSNNPQKSIINKHKAKTSKITSIPVVSKKTLINNSTLKQKNKNYSKRVFAANILSTNNVKLSESMKEKVTKFKKREQGEGEDNSCDSGCCGIFPPFEKCKEKPVKLIKQKDIPYTITEGGFIYRVAENLHHDVNSGTLSTPLITVNASGVILELGGHKVKGHYASYVGDTSVLFPVILVRDSEEVYINNDKVFTDDDGSDVDVNQQTIALWVDNSSKVSIQNVWASNAYINLFITNSSDVEFLNGRIDSGRASESATRGSNSVTLKNNYIGPSGNITTVVDETVFGVYGIGGIFGVDDSAPDFTPNKNLVIEANTLSNVDVFIPSTSNFVFRDNLSIQEDSQQFVYAMVDLGQSEFVDVLEGFPAGSVTGFIIENNILFARNNYKISDFTLNYQNILINVASNGVIRNNILYNDAQGLGQIDFENFQPIYNFVAYNPDFLVDVVTAPVGSNIIIGHEGTSGFQSHVFNILIENNVMGGFVDELENEGISFIERRVGYGILILGDLFTIGEELSAPLYNTGIRVRNNEISKFIRAGIYVDFAKGINLIDNHIDDGYLLTDEPQTRVDAGILLADGVDVSLQLEGGAWNSVVDDNNETQEGYGVYIGNSSRGVIVRDNNAVFATVGISNVGTNAATNDVTSGNINLAAQ